jgi:tetratricopeptide (TPR) repeat protein
MTIRPLLAIALACALISSTALAQNALRPGRLPDGPARPIESASEEPKAALPAKPRQSPAARAAAAQEDGDSSLEGRLLLHEASQLSQIGKTLEQFTEMIDLSKRAAGTTLTPEEAKYARDLQSWAYNKRGEAHAAQAVDFLNQGSDKEAARLDRQALEDFKASVKLDPNRWKAIHNRAVSYGVLGLHEDATADFTRVLQLKPNYANAWFNRAEIFLESGRFAEAIHDYGEFLKLKPNDAAAYRQRGRALARSGKPDKAIEDLDQAIELNEQDAISLVERGELHAGRSDWEAADIDFRTAIEVDPDCAEGYRGAAWLMATCPQAKFRNAKIAVELAEQALELAQAVRKHDFTYYDTLAAAYANAGQFDDAQRTLHKAIPRAPLADAAAMKRRMALYAAARPFREAAGSSSVRQASLNVQQR